jgi:hypothetical protein
MTAHHSPLFTLTSGHLGLYIYPSLRDAVKGKADIGNALEMIREILSDGLLTDNL